jgi:hypothetical protein
MKKFLTTGSLATAGLATAALVAWQAPAAFADHGSDDSTQSSSVVHRHGNDDGPGHDANDDHGRHSHGNDDGPNHDANDDHGGHHGHGHGSDD